MALAVRRAHKPWWRSIVRINEKQWNAPTGDCLAMGAGLEVSGTLLYFPVFCKEPAARGRMRSRNEKPGAARRPGSWRSFGEYALLEDSRYTSQTEN